MRKIIYTRPDGGLDIVNPVRCLGDENMTDAEIEQRAWDKLPADAINPRYADPAEIPADRTFRDAWEGGAGRIAVNMAKAREIHKAGLRAIRKPLLDKLDIAYMRADELGDAISKARISARKKALRDVTADPAIEAATTPDELKAAIPVALTEAP